MPFDTEFDPNEVDAVDDPEVGAAMSNIERLWGSPASDAFMGPKDDAVTPGLDGMQSNASPDVANIGAQVAAPLRLRPQPKAPMPASKPAQGGAVDWQALKDNLDRASLGARGSRDAEQLFSNVSLGGYHTDPGRFQAQVDDAKRPLELAKAKQDFEGHALDQDVKRQKVGGDTAQRDPNSLQSQKARNAIKAFFPGTKLPDGFDDWSASDVKAFADSGTLARMDAARTVSAERDAKAKADATNHESERVRKEAADQRALANDTERARHNKETEGAMWKAAGRADKKAGKEAEGHPLPTTALNDLADFDAADGQIAKLENDFKAAGMSGPLAKASGAVSDTLGITSTDAAVYLNKAKQAQQIVGKILEGGKLAEGDERKYKGLIPQPGDSPALLESKTSGLRDFLHGLKEGRVKLYKAGGYKTPDFGGGAPETRKTKSGGVAYRGSKDPNRWWSSAEEAGAN